MRTVLNSSVDPLLGRLLDGRYEISGRIAQGGMAVVYSAFDTRLDRSVAVKVMHPALAADEEFVARFRREAKAAARLSNPHVVAVTDQGQDGDVIFLVMELIDGQTLRELLREAGRLDARQALEIMLPILDALAAAHRAGLVHRDVKPENVLVAVDGSVKVGDFGLARAVDASPLTATAGLLLGTVAYLAPEQVARGVADARADVYACGVVLFELLTGHPPFQGTSALQVAYQHLNENVPAPSSLVEGIPPAVDRLVAAATARDPADRPHDATALLFRTRAVLERLEPAAAGSVSALSQNDTAPLDLTPASVEILAGVSGITGAAVVNDADSIDAIAEALDDSYADLSEDLGGIAGGTDLSAAPAAQPGKPTKKGSGRSTDVDLLLPADEDPATGKKLSRRKRKKEQRRLQAGPNRRFLRPSRIAALALILITVAAGLIGWRLATRTVSVPHVVGKSPAAAQTEIQKAHLKSVVAPVQVYSETVPKGDIAATDPATGRNISRGALVTLKVSLGPERYSVPTVTGIALADAVSALRVAHLHADQPTNGYSDTVKLGNVISTDPVAGKLVKPDTHVAIVVSQGPAPVKAPKVAGLQAAAATTQLQKLGLKVTTTQDFSDTVPAGQVIGMSPSKDLHRTQSVKLSISKGPQLVTIPFDIENYNPSNVKQILNSLGLNPVTYSFPGLDSRVLSVKPDPGTSVRVGSNVTIYLY